MMGALGLGTAAAGLGAGAALADDPHQHDEAEHGAHAEHLKAMTECARICNETAHHCLAMMCEGKGDIQAHAKVHQFAMDCQAFCNLSAALMARHSPLAGHAHMANAEACAACAEACEAHKDAGDIVRQCLESCRACEKACRAAAGDHHHGA
jgi:hypothetical protein